MPEPKEVYQHRLQARLRELEAVRIRYDAIAWSRLVSFVLSGALAIVAWRWHLGLRGWLAAASLFALFVVLVALHTRLARRRAHAQAAIAWHRRALERIAGQWTAFAERGDQFTDDAHPYALDLDIFGHDSLFQYLNDTRTPFGERTLAQWLAAPAARSEILERQDAVRELSGMLDLREALYVAGARQSGNFGDPKPLLTWCDSMPPPALSVGLRLIAWLLPVLLVGDLIAASIQRAPAWPALLLFVINLLVLQSLRTRLQPVIHATSSRSEELARFGDLLALIERQNFQSPSLKAISAQLSASGAPASVEIARLSRLVSMLDARQNGAFRAIIGPALLWDLHWVSAIEAWQRRAGRAARAWLESLGSIEALASLACFAFDHPGYAMPEIDPSDVVFDAKALGHALLEPDRRVTNDVTLPGAGAALLVTGSNMSGKSTLLRAIGVAAVLAMAGAPVCASALRIGICRVRTSMRVSDSLRDGISRFYAELLKLKAIVETARSGAPVLFLLDEILHGTNSRERHIGARSIMRTLMSHNASGAVSTHDLALAELEQTMAGKVRNVHFEEQVQRGEMTFDYRLREGVVRSGNALRWMRHVGLEVDEE